MQSTATPRQTCPRCQYSFDRAAGAFTDRNPKPGDITLCLRCGHAMVFREDFTIRSITEQEYDDLGMEEKAEILRCYQAIRELAAKRN